MNSFQTLVHKKFISNGKKKPLGVLTGFCGSGKTTLYNKLCNTKRLAKAGFESVTRDLCLDSIAFGQNPMDLIDSPGNNSTVEAYKHAYLLHACLTSKLINTIFIIMKYENRYADFLKILDYQLQFLQKYEKKVVVMISHWDHASNPTEEFPIICQGFNEYEISNIICFSDKGDNDQLADIMHSCASNMEPEKIDIPKKEFFMNFNILDQKRQIKKQFGLFNQEIKNLYNIYTQSLQQKSWLPPAEEGRDELLGIMIIQFKEDLNVILSNFQKACFEEMVDLDYYTLSIKMEKENIALCDEFVSLANKHMTWDYYNKKDPRHLIKRCPYCQEIWFKTGGCDSITQCGNVDNSGFFYDLKELVIKPWYKYKILFKDKKLIWVKEDKIVQEKKTDIKYESKAAKQKRGCGKDIDWKTLAPLEEKLFLELFGTKSIEDIEKIVNEDKFIEIREKIEKEIKIDLKN